MSNNIQGNHTHLCTLFYYESILIGNAQLIGKLKQGMQSSFLLATSTI